MTFNFDLKNNTKLLFSERPKNDESFDSLVVRNALCNYLTLGELNEFIFTPKDESKLNNPTTINGLCNNLFLCSDLIRRYQGNHKWKNLTKIASQFNYPTKTYLKAKNYPAQYCPGCLSKNNPHFQEQWFNALFYCCIYCGCYLINGCYHCEAPILISKIKPTIPYDKNKIAHCYACDLNLGLSPRKNANEEAIKLQKNIQSLILQNELEKIQFISAAIDVFLGSSSRSMAARKYFKIDRFSTHFQCCDASERYLIIKSAYYWLNNKYITFNGLNKMGGFRMISWLPNFKFVVHQDFSIGNK